MLPLMLYKLVDPTPSVRDDAVHLWYELIRKFWNDDDPQERQAWQRIVLDAHCL